MIGLYPKLERLNEKWVVSLLQSSNEDLLGALSDKDRWIAAHVILTLKSKKPFYRSHVEWNLLKVDLYADGSAKIDESQKERIKKYWENKIVVE